MRPAVAYSLSPLSRMAIDDIPLDQRKFICTNIDYSIHEGNGHWDMIVSELGFSETDSKNFLLAFPKGQSPTENLLRECSYRNYRVSYFLQVLKKVGMVSLTEKITEELDKYRMGLQRVGQFSDLTPQKSSGSEHSLSDVDKIAGLDTIQYSYEEIERGTEYFALKMKLGAGAFGKVYKVKLKNTTFACKVLTISNTSPHFTIISKHKEQRDLRNELQYLAEYRHPNIIPLYGWSLDGRDPCLIYQYMKNGSLQDCLQLCRNELLKWVRRIRIACDAATGLQFLHTIKEKPLIHGDIKTANILLDEAFGAKLGDFGLAREGPRSHVTGSYIKLDDEHTPGTVGYLAPEYLRSKKLSVKVDTYAFGVVLLELYTGRMAFSRDSRHEPPILLRDFMDNIANDPNSEFGSEEALYRTQTPEIPPLPRNIGLSFTRLALECCHEKRNKRPSMPDVLKRLETLCVEIEDVMSNSDKDGQNSGSSSGSFGTPSMHSKPNWITGPHQLSRTPVESIDTSLLSPQDNTPESMADRNQQELSISNELKHMNLNNYNPYRPSLPHAAAHGMNGIPYCQTPNPVHNPSWLHPMVSLPPMGLVSQLPIPLNLQPSPHVYPFHPNMPFHPLSYYQPLQSYEQNAAHIRQPTPYSNVQEPPTPNAESLYNSTTDHGTTAVTPNPTGDRCIPDSMNQIEYSGVLAGLPVCGVTATPLVCTNQFYPSYTATTSYPSSVYSSNITSSVSQVKVSETPDVLKVNSIKAQLIKSLEEVNEDTDVSAILDKMDSNDK